jgi:hypothetical protein
MKKNMLFCFFLFVCCTTNIMIAKHDLFESIHAANVEEVKRRLTKIGSLDHDHKKTLLHVAKSEIEAAKDANKAFLKSKTDILVVGLGAPLSVGSALSLRYGLRELKDSANLWDQNKAYVIIALSSFGFGTSLYLTYSGLTLSYAHSRLQNLKEIKKLIKKS